MGAIQEALLSVQHIIRQALTFSINTHPTWTPEITRFRFACYHWGAELPLVSDSRDQTHSLGVVTYLGLGICIKLWILDLPNLTL